MPSVFQVQYYFSLIEAQPDIVARLELRVREEFSVKEILRHRWRIYPRFILDLAPTDQVTDSKIDSDFLPGNARSRHGIKLGGWNIQ